MLRLTTLTETWFIMEMFIRLINFPNSKLYQIFYKPWRFRTRGKDASLSGMGLVKVFSLVWKYSDSTRKRLLPNDRQKFSQRLWCWQLCCHKIQIMWSLACDINMACKSIYCSRFSLKSSPDPINEFDILRTFFKNRNSFWSLCSTISFLWPIHILLESTAWN